jgi:hypothetical protein
MLHLQNGIVVEKLIQNVFLIKEKTTEIEQSIKQRKIKQQNKKLYATVISTWDLSINMVPHNVSSGNHLYYRKKITLPNPLKDKSLHLGQKQS